MFYGKGNPVGAPDPNNGANRGNRNERYEQMVKQQRLIEEKKLQIQAKIESERQRKAMEALGKPSSSSEKSGASPTTSASLRDNSDEAAAVKQNIFSNDGSFLEQFKKMQEEALKKKAEAEQKANAIKIKQEQVDYDEYGSPIRKNSIKIINHEVSKSEFQPPVYSSVPPPPPPPPPKREPSEMKPFVKSEVLQFQATPPPPPPPPQGPPPSSKTFGGFPTPAVKALASIVAEQGNHVEEELRLKHQNDPLMWFLFKPDSTEYRTFRALVSELQETKVTTYNVAPPSAQLLEESSPSSNPPFAPVIKTENQRNLKRESEGSPSDYGESEADKRERKKRSRWGPQSADVPPVAVVAQPVIGGVVAEPSAALGVPTLMNMPLMPVQSTPLSKVTRTNPQLIAYAKQAYGRTDLDEDEWKQCEEAYKMNMMFQDLARKKAKDEALANAGKFKHEYDSDEETEGGTWEHKLRMKEMDKTREWADELTKNAKGKHHIGDFLPPEELSKFMEKYKAVKEGQQLDESEYQKYKIQQDNIGYKMLQKMGWSSGEGLGAEKQGITAPIDKGNAPSDKQGLGVEKPGELNDEDDEYTAYRKRMMLAYRFRPNPLNNPRRAYY